MRRKRIRPPRKNIPAGSFARILSQTKGIISYDEFTHCRDSFSYEPYIGPIIFSHDANQTKAIAAFMKRFEQKMKLNLFKLVRHTLVSCFSFIRPAWFWEFNYMRRSLFTALLRAGRVYMPAEDNFDEALDSVSYLKNTRPAVERFLAGHTWYTDEYYVCYYDGWHNQFSKTTRPTLHLLTRHPRNVWSVIACIRPLLRRVKDEILNGN